MGSFFGHFKTQVSRQYVVRTKTFEHREEGNGHPDFAYRATLYCDDFYTYSSFSAMGLLTAAI